MNRSALLLLAALALSGCRTLFPDCHPDELIPNGAGGFIIAPNPCRIEAP